MRAVFLALGAGVALALATSTALAVGTRTFELDSLDKLSGGDLTGVAVGSDGVVRAGWTLGDVPLGDTSAAWAALTLPDKSVLVGVTGGKVYRVANGVVALYTDTGTQAVTSLVLGREGVVYAGTLPDAKIFKLAQGKADLVAKLPGTHNIWALVMDRTKTALFAATGPGGDLFHVGLDGVASVYFHADDPSLVSLALADNGDVFAGSSNKGILYRVTGAGRASVVEDFPGDTSTEVRALALSHGKLYAVVNEYADEPEPPKRSAIEGRSQAGPSAGKTAKPGKGSLYRFDAEGRPEKLMHHDEFHYESLATDDTGLPYVGTGAEGRVYTVDDAHVVTLMADIDARQVGALVLTGGGSSGVRGLVAGSDPPIVCPIVGRGGGDAVWTSKALDAGLRARFGRLTWQAKGALEVTTRTGNTAAPDATWSPWSGPVDVGSLVASPAGRYLQVRARWSRDPNAELSDVVVPFVTENLRAVVTEVSAQARAGHESKEGLVPSGTELPKHDTSVKLTFHVDNPDGDTLRYRASFRRDGDPVWRTLTRPDEVLTKNETDWDTATLPEGRYRVRVTASDELANPPETTLEHTLVSPAIVVDNTPPVFRGLAIEGRRLRGHVVDGIGPIARIEVSVDSAPDWHPLAPADGVFDSADEAIDADIHTLVPPGAHIVAVRGYDAAGNVVVGNVLTP